MWIDRSARSHGPRAHVWNKNKLSWGVWGNVSEWSRLQIVVRQRHIVIATLRYWSSFSSSFFFFLIAICDAKVAMATVCLTGETMKKAIRSAPNQTKITLVPPLKKESSFDLFEAFEVSTYEGGTFQNIPSCSSAILVAYMCFSYFTVKLLQKSFPFNRQIMPKARSWYSKKRRFHGN